MITMKPIGNIEHLTYFQTALANEHPTYRSDARAAYYMKEGTPAGTWYGTALTHLGLTHGQEITPHTFTSIFAKAQHPITGTQLGRKLTTAPPLKKRVTQRIKTETPPNATPTEKEAIKNKITAEELQHPPKESVTGFELIFSPTKSISTLWALADPNMKQTIRTLHHESIQTVMKELEERFIKTRMGKNGVIQTSIDGLISAHFDHWDSREADPQLHTHVLIANRVRTKDGRWRTIDSRWSLFPNISTISAMYDTILMDKLTTCLGLGWTNETVLEQSAPYRTYLEENDLADSEHARMLFALVTGKKPHQIKWQLEDIPLPLLKEFSHRSTQVNTRTDQLITEWKKKHNQEKVPLHVLIRLREQASLRTRKKKQALTLHTLTQEWRQRAEPYIGDTFRFVDRIIARGRKKLQQHTTPFFHQDDFDQQIQTCTIQAILATLTEQQPTFTRSHVETLAYKLTAGFRYTTETARLEYVQHITDQVLHRSQPLWDTTKGTPTKPIRYKHETETNIDAILSTWAEATSVNQNRYTTAHMWNMEENLLHMLTETCNNTVDRTNIETILQTHTEPFPLSEEQQRAITEITCSTQKINVLIGPAGAGKTTVLSQVKTLWEQQKHKKVVGLAPTAKAAHILAESLHIETENTCKYLHTLTNRKEENTLETGDLLIIDESSLAGTQALHDICAHALKKGAHILLVGDPYQIQAVESGGAFAMLAEHAKNPIELEHIHRFNHEWEKTASLKLRYGKESALTAYINHDRFHASVPNRVEEAIIQAWEHDRHKPAGSLLLAATNESVQRLNHAAQHERIKAGEIDTTRWVNNNEYTLYVGDSIITRKNARTLHTTADRWVKNNDTWIVENIFEDGSILANDHGEHVHLPREYVQQHVQLGYATSIHRAQGRTSATCHTLIDSSLQNDLLYVAMTRGKEENHGWVSIEDEHSEANSELIGTPIFTPTIEQLKRILETETTNKAAHTIYEHTRERQQSISEAKDMFDTYYSHYIQQRFGQKILTHLQQEENNTIKESREYFTLCHAISTCKNTTEADSLLTQLLADVPAGNSEEETLHTLRSLTANIRQHTKNVSRSYIAGIVPQPMNIDDDGYRQHIYQWETELYARLDAGLAQEFLTDQPWIRQCGVPEENMKEIWRQHLSVIYGYRNLYHIDTNGKEHDLLGTIPEDTRYRWQQRQHFFRAYTSWKQLQECIKEETFQQPPTIETLTEIAERQRHQQREEPVQKHTSSQLPPPRGVRQALQARRFSGPKL